MGTVPQPVSYNSHSADECELTVLMPCLNEAETIGDCIRKAEGFLAASGITGEVLIADNGSSDASRAIATRLGARVVHVERKGYGSALLGGVLGAGLGAAVGGGRGAGIGAASGVVAGTAIGASGSANQQYGIQRQYDIAYSQCMYSRGNQVPGYGQRPAPGYGGGGYGGGQGYGAGPGYGPPPPPPGY